MGVLLGDNVSILTEAYYGKPKEFIECEKEFQKIIDAVKGKNGGKINGKTIQSSDSIKIIEKNIEKALKLKEFNLFVVDDYIMDVNSIKRSGAPMVNCYTFPYSLTSVPGLGKKIIDKGNMIKISTYINKSFIVLINPTAKELMAITLHEIGHNFDRSLFRFISTVLPWDIILNPPEDADEHIKMIINAMAIRPFSGIIGKYMGEFNKIINNIVEHIPHMDAVISRAEALITGVLMAIKKMSVFKDIKNINVERMMLRFANPSNFFGYSSEKYADSFASAYGYSVEIASAMRKFQLGTVTDDMIYQVPALRLVYDLGRASSSMLGMLTDVHPENSVRVYSQLKKMERELNDPTLPKEFKVEVQKQVNELKDMVERMTDLKADENRGRYATVCMNKILIDVFKGKLDPREWLELVWNHEE